MKILRGELKRDILYLIDICTIGLVDDKLAKIQSNSGRLKISHFYPQKSLKSPIYKQRQIPEAVSDINEINAF